MEINVLKAARRKALKECLISKKVGPAELVDGMKLSLQDKKNLKVFLYGCNSDSETLNVSFAKAHLLAPVLGVEPMDILIELTEKEKQMNAVSLSPSTEVDWTRAKMSDEDLQQRRTVTLDLFMTEKELSAVSLANEIEAKGNPDEMAMLIADARTGDQLLSDDLSIAIIQKYSLQPSAFGFVENSAAGSEPVIAKQIVPDTGQSPPRRKPGRKPGQKRETTAIATEQSDKGTEVSLTLKPEEMVQYFGKNVRLVETTDGHYFIKIEARLSQKDVIGLLMSQLKK
jgi:hypothetical protein